MNRELPSRAPIRRGGTHRARDPGPHAPTDQIQDSVTTVERNENLLRQVKALAGLLDIVPLTDRIFEIRKYAPSQVGAKVGGLYLANGAAHEVLRFEAALNTQGSLTVVKKLRVALDWTLDLFFQRTSCSI